MRKAVPGQARVVVPHSIAVVVAAVLALRVLGGPGRVLASRVPRAGRQGVLATRIREGHWVEVDPSIAIVVGAVIARE
jgi:hypothetical protein